LALLAVATLVPIGTLGWLALRLLRQDREMEGQRRRERLEYAAGRVALAAETRLAGIEEMLAQGRGIRLKPRGLEAAVGPPVLFQPRAPVSSARPADVFSTAESLEFGRHDPGAAAAAYRRLADSLHPAIRGGALVRLGRVLRASGDREGALEAYRRLLPLGSTIIDEQPAGMIARQALCRIYQQGGDASHLKAEAAALQEVLYSGSVAMDRATFALYRDLLGEWGGAPPAAGALARTEAAIALWHEWSAGALPARGRKLLRTADEPGLAIWVGGPDRPVAWLGAGADLEAVFDAAAGPQHLAACGYNMDGRLLFGSPASAATVTLSPGETRLPVLLRLAFQPGYEADGHWAARRNLAAGGLVFTFALMLTAAYGLWRAITREIALARQQSDFISAVSHEFRTPITSMRHLTELLATHSVPTEARRTQYYELLARETERLHRMVESLLSFGRMQAGSYAWKLETADAGELVRAAADEFRREAHGAGREIACDVESGLPPIHVDREALGRALSNLLDNAAKYSDAGTPIHVAARRDGDSVRISVKDHGVGIPVEEQKKLFERFVRGAHARTAGIRGIGVGLALVKSVAEAHGGTVLLESEPGRGSTFTLVIPCHAS
jgi:signal transduction histidine kinase